jgi:S1-C subfamily serine protease
MNSVRGMVLGLAVALGGGAALAQGGAGAAPARADQGADLQKLMDTVAPKLVTVKFILKMEMADMGMEGQEQEMEVAGVLIDAKGLVLASNTQLGGFAEMMRGMMGDDAGSVSATPKDVKVLIGDDTEGLKAEVVARDRELDLAWVRITDAGDKTFDALDTSKGGTAKVGDKLYVVEKLGKYFDRAPIVVEDRVAGTTKKPRSLVVPMGGLAQSMGKPVFTADGSLLGMVVLQLPGTEEMSAESMMSGFGDTRGFSGMILPASEISKATERAMAQAASGAKPDAPKASPPKPEAPKPDNKK